MSKKVKIRPMRRRLLTSSPKSSSQSPHFRTTYLSEGSSNHQDLFFRFDTRSSYSYSSPKMFPLAKFTHAWLFKSNNFVWSVCKDHSHVGFAIPIFHFVSYLLSFKLHKHFSVYELFSSPRSSAIGFSSLVPSKLSRFFNQLGAVSPFSTKVTSHFFYSSHEISSFNPSLYSWRLFWLENLQRDLYDYVRQTSNIAKRDRLYMFSFFGYYLDAQKLERHVNRILLPSYSLTPRETVFDSSQAVLSSSSFILHNLRLNSSTVHTSEKSSFKSQRLWRRTGDEYTSSDSENETGPESFDHCHNVTKVTSRRHWKTRHVSLQSRRVKKIIKRTRSGSKFHKSKFRSSRPSPLVGRIHSFVRFVRRYRANRIRRRLTKNCRIIMRKLSYRERKFLWKVTILNRRQVSFYKRSSYRYILSRWQSRIFDYRDSIQAPDQKFSRRQQGVYFRPHRRLRKAFQIFDKHITHSNIKVYLRQYLFNLRNECYPTLTHSSSKESLAKPVTLGASTSSTKLKSSLLQNWTCSTHTYNLLWSNHTIFKYLFVRFLDPHFEKSFQRADDSLGNNVFPLLSAFSISIQNQQQTYQDLCPPIRINSSNLWNGGGSSRTITKKLFRYVVSNSFPLDLSIWYYKTLIQFIENCSGRRTALLLGPFIQNALTYEDRARCSLWNNRVTGFQRIMGGRIFVHEALSIIVTSIRIKDPTFLSNWIRAMLKRLSFWKYRLIFRYVKFVLLYVLKPNFHLLDFRGVKLQLKGKISVAGNARTRTLFLQIGDTSHSKMKNRVIYDLSFVNTFTGVLGFKLWFFY